MVGGGDTFYLKFWVKLTPMAPKRQLLLVVLGLRAIVYIALSCVTAVVLHSVLSSNNKGDDLIW